MWFQAVLVVLIAVVAAGVDPSWAGAIHGTVVLQGPPPEPKKIPVTIDQYVCGEAKDAEDLVVSPKNGIRYAVAWLERPPSPGSASPRTDRGRNPAPSGAAAAPTIEMDQKGCMFTPRVVLVPVGGTVNFLNSDRLLHNLHGRPNANPPFNRTQSKGRTIPMTFAQPEIVRVDCDLHSWMRGWIVVADHPFYAISDAEGQFRIDDVAPGTYSLTVWHEKLGTTSREVVVPATGPGQVRVELRSPATPR